MCKILYRTVFIFKGLVATLFFAGYMTGNEKITIPMERARSALPDLNFGFSAPQRFSAMRTSFSSDSLDLKDVPSGYEREYGSLVSLSDGTCEQCMGSPKSGNSHIAVAMNKEYYMPDSCPHLETNTSICFSMRKTDVLVVIAAGPLDGIFEEFSWGVYLYDRKDLSSRDLIQAPLYDPLRLTRAETHALVVGFVPDIVDHIIETIGDRYVTHAMPIPERYVKTGDMPQDNDRISIVLKSIPKRGAIVDEFYEELKRECSVVLFKLTNPELVQEYSMSDSYSRLIRHSTINGKISTERDTLERDMEAEISTMPKPDFVTRMRDLRRILGTTDIEKCIDLDMNCLAEDWDVSYTVSDPLIFPRDPRYKVLVFGVDHPEASRTTLGLFEAETNREVFSVPKISENGKSYKVWLAANCSEIVERCYQVPFGENALFLRERMYGVTDAKDMVEPFVIRWS